METPIYTNFIPQITEHYNRLHKNKLNMEHPVTFTEKIQWLKVYDSTFLKTFCADKINVHKYFIKTLGKDIGVPILKIFKDANDIKQENISKPCAIKCNHGSGMNIVINGQHKPTLDAVKQKIANWLRHDHGKSFYETHYSLISPTAFSEKYIENMKDVKVFCFNGHPKLYQIDTHLIDNKMNFYDINWNPCTWLSGTEHPADYGILDSQPNNLETVYEYALKLCKPFKFVRVDFIVSQGYIYMAENSHSHQEPETSHTLATETGYWETCWIYNELADISDEFIVVRRLRSRSIESEFPSSTD